MPELLKNNPAIMSYWDRERNTTLNPDNLNVTSSKRAYWYCSHCDYRWLAAISTSYKKSKVNPLFCPCCNLGEAYVKGVNSIADKFPDFENYLNFHKEDLNSINELLNNECFTSKRLFHFKCPTCRLSWRDVANSKRLFQSENGELYHIGCNENSYHYKYKEVYPNINKIYQSQLNKPALTTLELNANVTLERHWQCYSCHNSFALSIDKLFNQIMRHGYFCETCKASFSIPFGHNKILVPLSYISSNHLKEWYPYNDLKISQIDLLSNIPVKWICSICHGIYSCRVFEKAGYSCPYCNDEEMYEGVNTLQDTHPYLQTFWHPRHTNKLTHYWHKSTEVIQWRCPCCLVDFECSPVEMISRTNIENQNFQTCPNSCDWVTQVFHNHFFTETPLLVKEWSNKNEMPIHLANTTINTKKYWWTCSECHGDYLASIPIRREVQQTCPYCNGEEALEGYNTLATLFPELATLWSHENKLTAEAILANEYDTKCYLWYCNICQLTFTDRMKSVLDRYANNGKTCIEKVCPYCNKVLPKPHIDSLDAVKPYIIDEWVSEQNGDISKVFPDSEKLYWWKCSVCNSYFEEQPCSRKEDDKCCYRCNGKYAIRGVNDLGTTHPELIKEWSRNNQKSIHEVKSEHTNFVLWNCSVCSGTYYEAINIRVKRDFECPYCSGKKVLEGFNSFKCRQPELVKEWDCLNNILLADPDKIKDTSQINVWWICKNNSNHRYKLSVRKRVLFEKRLKEPCSICKGLRRKREHFIPYKKI